MIVMLGNNIEVLLVYDCYLVIYMPFKCMLNKEPPLHEGFGRYTILEAKLSWACNINSWTASTILLILQTRL